MTRNQVTRTDRTRRSARSIPSSEAKTSVSSMFARWFARPPRLIPIPGMSSVRVSASGGLIGATDRLQPMTEPHGEVGAPIAEGKDLGFQ